MSRRVSLPGADELFRATATAEPDPVWVAGLAPQAAADQLAPASLGTSSLASSSLAPPSPPAAASASAATTGGVGVGEGAARPAPVRRSGRPRRGVEHRPTGRERHEEKITVYVSAEELVDLEQARLALRAEHGLAIDRGRIVREALAVVLADLEAKGEASILVRRLTGR